MPLALLCCIVLCCVVLCCVVLCCLTWADEIASPFSSSPTPTSEATGAEVWSGVRQRRPTADVLAPGSWLPSGRPIAVCCPAVAAEVTKQLQAASKSSTEEAMYAPFLDLLCLSLAIPAVDRILPSKSSGLSGCGAVKLGSEWKLLDTHSTQLSTADGHHRKPDCVLFPVSVNSASFAPCAFTVELQLPALDTDHRARCATYNTKMLEANANRSFALSAVTDLRSIMFLRTTRSTPSDTNSALQHVYSDDLDVEKMGWDMLLTVLQHPSDWTGFSLPRLQFNGRPVRLLQYLGHGATSQVWLCRVDLVSHPSNPSASRSQDLVCKMFQRDEAFDDERATWEGIRAREASLISSATAATDPRLKQLVSRRRLTLEGEHRPVAATPSFGGALFFQPRGAARHRDVAAIESVRDLQDAFACLEWLRELRVIHRDLSPRHFLRHEGQLFLIDFGFALLLRADVDLSEEADEEVSFSGSSFYAPNSVLQVLAVSRTALYRATLAHDLESLVKLCFADRNAGERKRLKLLDRRAYTSILEFWRDCEQRMDGQVFGQRWAEALQHARDNKLEETRNALLPLFQHR